MSETAIVEFAAGVPSKRDHKEESAQVARNSVLLEPSLLPLELSAELNDKSPSSRGSKRNSPARMSYRANGTSGAGQQRLPINPPTLIQYEKLRFLIADAPSDRNLIHYVKEFEKYKVTDVVRVCDPTYSIELLEEKNIKIHDWVFGDGEAPPAKIVNDWLDLVERRFGNGEDEGSTIACHCVAGLGRAPVLIAIALIEAGMKPLDSVEYIRKQRRGAINKKQLKYIESYKRRSKKSCIIC
jgi:protein tyrosine phosphatase type 4A